MTPSLRRRFAAVRERTIELCAPLAIEDHVVQSMTDASPAKWHLAHTTWFFETFVLRAFVDGYRPHDPSYGYLFNSYYNLVGERVARAARGMLTRPTVDEVLVYRTSVDAAMGRLLREPDRLDPRARFLVELGIQHEQQHQELLVTDLKHLLSINPLAPVYREDAAAAERDASDGTSDGNSDGSPVGKADDGGGPAARDGRAGSDWLRIAGGVYEIGHPEAGITTGAAGEFAYDNEGPRHRVHLEPFEIAAKLVTNREYLAFIEDGGYRRPEFWLDEGWARVTAEGWNAPLYWRTDADRGREVFTLGGLRPLQLDEPVCHVSFYEADAFARWAGARLPLESEWEVVARDLPAERAPVDGAAIPSSFAGSRRLHPRRVPSDPGPHQFFGDVWEWTGSPYRPYPGFRAPQGAVGEYNGKFMCSQFVLRGGSCATPEGHVRPTYRNFFHPEARWQFSGIRLAREVG